jgi:hypothetical protein
MLKSFITHMQENTKLYEFQIRLAVLPGDEVMKRIESALDAYQLESITKPKSLPIQEDLINFPKLGPIEICLLEVTLAYPVIPEAIQRLLVERAGLPTSHIVVNTKAQEADRTPAMPDYEAGEALLNTAFEDADPKDDKVYGNEFVSEFLDSIESRDWDIAGDNTKAAVTTNDLDQGTVSPMTNQNKVPKASDLS